MFGRSLGRKTMVANLAAVLNGFVEGARRSDSSNIDRDAVLLFSGWLHFAITFFLSRKEMRSTEIQAVLIDAALAVRKFAPNHKLGVSYISDGMDWVKGALIASGSSRKWVVEYYGRVKELTTLDIGSFSGALARETHTMSAFLKSELADA